MRVDIKIPIMGESIVEATIGAILKPSGSTVRAEEEIVEIETDKVNQVLYAPVAGKIQFSIKSGDVVQVDQTIGFIEASTTSTLPSETSAPPIAEKVKPTSTHLTKLPPTPSRKTVDEALAEMTQPPKGLEKELGVEPPRTHVAHSLESRTMGRETRKKMTKLRRVIAERLVEVKNRTALLTTFNEVDLSAVIAVREESQENFQKKHGVKLGFMSFFVKACISALQEFPEINARIDQDEIVYHHDFNVGVAVSTEKGLMVPVIRNADRLSYAEIEKALKNFAERAKSGTLSIDEMQGGTFTITNGGVFGSLFSTPILNPPQSGILGMHNIVKRPVAIDDQVVIRPMMYLALSYDHRIVDGRESICFLSHLKKNLEDPARLLLNL